MLVCVSAVLLNASIKSPLLILSKALAGKLVRLEQPDHARKKLIPEDMLMNGKLVRLLQLSHANLKFVPADVSIRGKLVRLEQ